MVRVINNVPKLKYLEGKMACHHALESGIVRKVLLGSMFERHFYRFLQTKIHKRKCVMSSSSIIYIYTGGLFAWTVRIYSHVNQ